MTKTKPGGNVVTKVNALHMDGLGSVRAVTDETGFAAERSTYRPFGEEAAQTLSLTTPKETRGFIGERFDDTSGLQYLNARYYDPKLGMFVQPDWWEVMQEGVGTNRYTYSSGDPVNGKDPGGHAVAGTSIAPEDKDKALDRSEKTRDDMTDFAENLDKLAEREKPIGFLEGLFGDAETRGMYRDQQRANREFPGVKGNPGALKTVAATYRDAAGRIGPRGSGAIIHNDSVIDAALRSGISLSRLPPDQRRRVEAFGGAPRFLERKKNAELAGGKRMASANFANQWFGLEAEAFSDLNSNPKPFDYYVAHEAMHLVSRDIQDSAYHGTPSYRDLTTASRLKNADSYACGLYGC